MISWKYIIAIVCALFALVVWSYNTFDTDERNRREQDSIIMRNTIADMIEHAVSDELAARDSIYRELVANEHRTDSLRNAAKHPTFARAKETDSVRAMLLKRIEHDTN